MHIIELDENEFDLIMNIRNYTRNKSKFLRQNIIYCLEDLLNEIDEN